eukprot:scaffold16706_cov153-Amphora_coffeaeformis.AAC.2
MCRTVDGNNIPFAKASLGFSSSMILWFDSWRNHVLHSSIYVGVITVCLRSSSKGNKNSGRTNATVPSMIANWLVAGFAAYCLKGELVFMWKRRRLPPGDSGLPIVGHLPTIMNEGESAAVNAIRKYGPLSTHNLLMNPVVLMTDEEDVRWAMTQERKGKLKALMLPHFLKLVGEDSIMVKSGEEHKRLRKVFEPAFTPTAIRDYATTIDSEVQKKLTQWSESGKYQGPVEWALLAMRIFFVCAFGEANDEKMVKLADLFNKWIKGFSAPIPMRIPGTTLAKAHVVKAELGNMLKEMVDEFKEQNPPDSNAAKTSVLGRLCYAEDENGKLPTEKVLIDNLRFFLFAGFDTTKASFGAISYYLKQHPKLEAALVKEVQGFRGEVLDIDKLKNEAPVLNALMAESWRLAAPLASHATVAAEDLEYKGYLIPKGTFVTADVHAHAKMNNELYPGAEIFCFERWLPKDHPLYDPSKANTEEIDYNVMSSKFRSFNHGPHMCLGAHFAKLEVRIVLTRLFQSYKLEVRNETVANFPLKQILSEFKVAKL